MALEVLSIKDVVTRWSEFLVKDLQQSLSDKHVGVTGDLFSSFRVNIISSADTVAAVVLTFNRYGRFVDMGVGKGRSLRGGTVSTTARKAARMRAKIKIKRWYSKVKTHKIHQLSERLLARFGIEILKTTEIFDENITFNIYI